MNDRNFELAMQEHERNLNNPYEESLTPEELEELKDDIGNFMYDDMLERQIDSYLWSY